MPVIKIKTAITLLAIFFYCLLYAQPGDSNYRLIVSDNYSYVNCTSVNCTFKVYGCRPEGFIDDFRIPKWRINSDKLVIIDTLKCYTNNDTILPYSSYYYGQSNYETKVLLIIKNNLDTMFIEGLMYSLVADYYGTENGLPPVIPFKKGIFNLAEMQKERDYRLIQNLTFRNYWLFNPLNKPVYNNNIQRISELSLLKKYYKKGDTLEVKITGKLMSDGSCGDRMPVWILQKKNGSTWTNAIGFLEQMNCGKGQVIAEQISIPFALINPEPGDKAFYTNPIHIDQGTYRIVVFDDNWLPYFTEEFHY